MYNGPPPAWFPPMNDKEALERGLEYKYEVKYRKKKRRIFILKRDILRTGIHWNTKKIGDKDFRIILIDEYVSHGFKVESIKKVKI